MNLPLLEEKEFTQSERMQFAARYLPIFTDEEEQISNPIKTSRFQETDPMEEYHVPLQNGDTLGFIKTKSHIDFDANFRSQERLVSIFRQMALDPYMDQGITQITDEAMNFNHSPNTEPMKLVINKSKLDTYGFMTDKIESKISESYEECLAMLDFREKGWEYFKQWFVDGKIFFELVFNKGEESIQEILPISPYNILKVKYKNESYYLYDGTKEKEVLRRNMLEDDAYIDDVRVPIVDYTKDFKKGTRDQVKLIPEKYVLAVESGIKPFGYPLSPLYYCRKLLNQLQLLQDAVVVYRISRAPERRIIYIDVGNIRRTEVKQAIDEVAKEFKQKLVFDHRTGNILDQRHVFATTEDFFIPRFNNGQTTQIDTLKGGEQLGKMQDVEYFQEQVFRSMKIPLSRFGLGDSSIVNIGNDSSVERDEITFSKYVNRLRLQFNKLIWGLLQRQLLCNRVITLPSEFKKLKLALALQYEGQNYYADMQRFDLYQKRLTLFQQAEPSIDSGRLSEIQVYRDVFGMSEEDIDNMYAEKGRMVEKKLKWLQDYRDKLDEIAMIEGELALAQDPELQFRIESLKVKDDFTKEKYGNDYAGDKSSKSEEK